MMNYDKSAQRYLNDPEFHCVVGVFYSLLLEQKMTISELKDALMFAAIKFENEHVSNLIKF